MSRTVLHVDMDAFFASIEEREDPALRGRPVVVGADPRGGEGRGVVAAANYEARRHGIHSAMPISRAYRRCPEAVWLRPRGQLYARVSARIFEIYRGYTDLVEPLSIDEAFLDVTASRRLHGDGGRIAAEIREDIRSREGLTASVGVAASKFVAKLASDLEKPDGLVRVPPGREREFLEPIAIEHLWGAGPKALERFRSLGVATIGQASRVGLETMTRVFGETAGPRFHRLCAGIDPRPVTPDRIRKSLGKETTFAEDVADRDRIRRALLDLSEKVARRLRREDLAGTTVTLKLRWEGFETLTRQRTLERPVDTASGIWPVARELFARADQPGRRIRLVGVTVSGFRDRAARQLSLFEEGDGCQRDRRVASALDELSARFGDRTLTRAELLEE